MKKRKADWLRAIGVATSAGMTLLVMILAGLYLGHLADDRLATAPLGLAAGGIVGAGVGIWSVITQIGTML